MTPDEQAVVDAAKAWNTARNQPSTVDDAFINAEEVLANAVSALEPPKPELPDAPPVGSYVRDGDGDIWMCNEHAWNCLTASAPPTTWAEVNNLYGPLMRLASESATFPVDLARKLMHLLAGTSARAHVDQHEGAWHDCITEECSGVRELVARAKAALPKEHANA